MSIVRTSDRSRRNAQICRKVRPRAGAVPHCQRPLILKGMRYWVGIMTILVGPLALLMKVNAHWLGIPETWPLREIMYVCIILFAVTVLWPGRLRAANAQ